MTVPWLTDLIRLEIALWERVDARLRADHDLPLASFEALYLTAPAGPAGLRVGDLARALRVTVGGTSKLVDRVEAAGLVRRVPDPDDRRASRVALTPAGRRTLTAASRTYERVVKGVLDPVLTVSEQRAFHDMVRRLLAADRAGP